ncbi:MAG TPA: hypothetical protein VMH84_02070 [Xanthobacteraceae bacterium]|nr:hypothetical protein [Xanthobacteraceae bacterium]
MRKTILLLALMLAPTSAHAQSTSGASSSVDISNPASTDSRNHLITPPTVVAPGLAAAGVETCLGSSSGGFSIMGGGLTFGRTYTDEGCTMRLTARQLYAFGHQKAAMALMCQDPHVAEAMAAAGDICPTPIAESGPRRRQRNAELDSVTADRPPERTVGHILDLSNTRTSAASRPADRPRRTLLAFFLASDLTVEAPSTAEERAFARASAVY